ncbi:replication restart DNA helicase PriA [Formivibrio citricus]|uniref:Replication restart protein PriA n=1 Tax=Formivibrio citricus TaxID=83765 RepID=A0A1I5D816_9NEIS|nr:primosomal protein N' [Formivibrio citricus]SFN95333.1 replication restart DNA helicase PriA [Formivibrio citricus]
MICAAQVALDVPLTRLFSYAVDGGLLAVGERVFVPFGHRVLSGVVAGLEEVAEGSMTLKAVQSVPRDLPCLSPEWLALCRFVADYYHHPLGQVIATALPAVFRIPEVFTPAQPPLLYRCDDVEALLARLAARATAQRRVAQALAVPQTAASLRALAAPAMRWIASWLEQGWIEAVPETAMAKGKAATNAPVPNPEQARAVEAIASAEGFVPFLLFGVTGSGKTEVYLQTIATVLARGKQALVLVPEINLTPQAESAFRARFPQARIVSLHSRLNDSERAQGWLAAMRGEADIVLGTRLAVLAPLPRLGLVVVDEEHDASFKQQDGLRYSARDIAVYRASQEGIPVVLGSATPSLESWRNAESGRYRLLELPARAVPGAALPELRVLSMRRAPQRDGLHESAIAAIGRALDRGEQALVFINRRGYAPTLACGECGWSASCRHCSARLVLHLGARRLRCHHCGYELRIPPACPDCGNQDLKPLGRGTQRLEENLQALFPGRNILRIDRDSTRRKGAMDAALEAVHAGEADILVGTQMLAKGHDFPRLNCVLVLEADSGLFSVDYRAEERLFALLTQVAGRAGRREQPGEVLVQTQFPEHPFYAQLLQRDYRVFADRALSERRDLRLPPFAAWALFRAEAQQLDSALEFLRTVKQCFVPEPGLTIGDPVAATMLKKSGLERAQLLVSAENRQLLQRALAMAEPAMDRLKAGRIRWSLDVDPAEV